MWIVVALPPFAGVFVDANAVAPETARRVGKTVAVRAAISQLDQAAHHLVYLANPTVGTRGLYVNIVQALGAVPRGFRAELVAQTQSLLATEEHERRRRVVLVIDEAHLLSSDQLEAIRRLTKLR